MLVWKLVSEPGAVMAFPTLSNKKKGDSDEEAAQDGVTECSSRRKHS